MKSVLNKKITLFKNYKSITGGVQVNLLEYLQDDSYYFHQVEIAKHKQTDPEQYKKLKAEMICILPSCTDCTDRKADAVYTHTGLMQIDIDLDKNTHITDWEKLKIDISHIPQVAYCGLSVSNLGLWAIIPISNTEKHLEHFLYVEDYFRKRGYTIDASCKNVQRLRGYSFDPNAYYNHQAQTLSNFCKPIKAPPRPLNTIHGTTDNHISVKAAIDQINARNLDIAPDYESYLELAFCFANEFGANGEGYFLDVCSHHHAYDEKKAIAKYKNALATNSGRVSIGTFFHLCKLAGITINNPNNNRITTVKPFWKSENSISKHVDPVQNPIKDKGIESYPEVSFSPRAIVHSAVKQIIATELSIPKPPTKLEIGEMIVLKNKAANLIGDPSYKKWVIKEFDKAIQLGTTRNRCSPEISQLLKSIESN